MPIGLGDRGVQCPAALNLDVEIIAVAAVGFSTRAVVLRTADPVVGGPHGVPGVAIEVLRYPVVIRIVTAGRHEQTVAIPRVLVDLGAAIDLHQVTVGARLVAHMAPFADLFLAVVPVPGAAVVVIDPVADLGDPLAPILVFEGVGFERGGACTVLAQRLSFERQRINPGVECFDVVGGTGALVAAKRSLPLRVKLVGVVVVAVGLDQLRALPSPVRVAIQHGIGGGTVSTAGDVEHPVPAGQAVVDMPASAAVFIRGEGVVVTHPLLQHRWGRIAVDREVVNRPVLGVDHRRLVLVTADPFALRQPRLPGDTAAPSDGDHGTRSAGAVGGMQIDLPRQQGSYR